MHDDCHFNLKLHVLKDEIMLSKVNINKYEIFLSVQREISVKIVRVWLTS